MAKRVERPDNPAVLVVDDDQDMRELLVMLIEEAGYKVITAADGAAALSRLLAHPAPLIVVLDWWMPGMDGIDVLQSMAEQAPEEQRHVYLLLTIRHEAARPLLAALPAHLAVTLVGKPFDIDDLHILVDRAAKHLRDQRP
jgi:two-component system, NtrC family, sensor kinase